MRVAIVHEWLVNFRGSEKVLLELARMFPDADLYASVADPDALPAELQRREIKTTWIQRLPGAKRHYQIYLPLMPWAYASINVSAYDLVITSSHSCANGIRPRKGAVHLSYCYTPMRYAWSGYHEYRQSLRPPVMRWLMSAMMLWLRRWDYRAAQRVGAYIACSTEVQQRIERYYGRESVIVYPPVGPSSDDLELSVLEELLPRQVRRKRFYLSLGRLVMYKRVDLAIAACNHLQRWLVVAGAGPEIDRLRAMSGPTILLIGECSDELVRALYQACDAFVFPGFEDFGLTVVEAQMHGKPVVAYGRGGAVDTINDGETGVLFHEQTVDSLIAALQQLDSCVMDRRKIQQNATKFSLQAFKSGILQEVNRHMRGESSSGR